jgi:hypothetical protein
MNFIIYRGRGERARLWIRRLESKIFLASIFGKLRCSIGVILGDVRGAKNHEEAKEDCRVRCDKHRLLHRAA